MRSDVKLAGPAKLMLASALALQDSGAYVVIVSSGGAMVPEIVASGIKHITLPGLRIGTRSLINSARASLQLIRLVYREKIQIIHSFNALAGLVSIPASLLVGGKIFNTVLGYGKEKFLRFAPFRIIAVSQFVSRQLQNAGVQLRKISVVYNSTLDSRFILPTREAFEELEAQRSLITPFTFISVAMFTGQKGHYQILDAVLSYRRRHDALPINVVMIGDGPLLKEVRFRADSLGILDSICFQGASAAVDEQMNTAHAFIHLPTLETFGIVIAEANARGLPVIASNVGGIPEVMLDGETGILVDPNDAIQVADAMAALINNPLLRQQFGWNGAQHARARFSRDQIAKSLLRLYGSCNT